MFFKITMTLINVVLTGFLCWVGTFVANIMNVLWVGLLWDAGILLLTFFDLRKVWRGDYQR